MTEDVIVTLMTRETMKLLCLYLGVLPPHTLTTSTSVELQVTESSTSLTCPSVSTVTSLIGTATRRPVRIAVFTTSVSWEEESEERSTGGLKKGKSKCFTIFDCEVTVCVWGRLRGFCCVRFLPNQRKLSLSFP